jgi:hypothetical protein
MIESDSEMAAFGGDDAKEKTVAAKAGPSRRALFTTGAAAGVTRLANPHQSFGDEVRQSPTVAREANVRDFGSAGDGRTDETLAFQKALDTAHGNGGGSVYAPTGRYLIRGVLTISPGVALRGSFSCVPSHAGIRDQGQVKAGEDGTVLLAIAGRGKEDGDPFVTLNTNSSVSGLTIYYPDQSVDGIPLPYPWSIAMRGKNPAAFDLELLNPYQGIYASRNERHNIRNISGQPLRRGIWVDAT